MSEYIKNGDFSSGFLYWTNGAAGGLPYTLDSGRIKASSDDDALTELDYKIRQTIAINDEVISAKISAYGYWDNEDSDTDGTTKYRIGIQKPDTSWYYPLALTSKDGIGNGSLLSEYNITSELSQQGNYIIQLQTLVASAKDSESVTNLYSGWVNSGFTIVGSTQVKKLSGVSDVLEYSAGIYKNFTIDFPATNATITVSGKGKVTPGADSTGYARLKVRLRKPDLTWVDLYDGYQSDDVWKNLLSGIDISSYMTQAGQYRIRLEAYVKSSFDASPPTWYQSEAWFGTVNLSVDAYDQSFGWLDNISLDIAVKKKKTVMEILGGEGKIDDFSAISEGVTVGESVGAVINSYVTHDESEQMKSVEDYFRTFKRTVLEVAGMEGSYTSTPGHYYRTELEEMGLTEIVKAKKISGNVETTYEIEDLTEWLEKSAVVTQWRKEKVEV